MINFILLLFFLFGCLVGVVLAFLFLVKKKIALNRDKNKNEYLELLNRYNKNEKELLKYKNEFNNKYVDDGYDTY